MTTKSPVLFLVYNRVDVTRQVFQAIREAKPTRLYIASDGARISRLDDDQKVQEVRDYVMENIDWPCTVQTLFRNENLGCKFAVASAITWFFDQESEGIILEDDCLPAHSFFQYCDDLLERYRDDERVFCVGGEGTLSSNSIQNDSYWFSKYVMIWGWASWRRAWKHYEVDIHDSWNANKRRFLKRIFVDSPSAKNFWRSTFTKVAAGKIDTWDYQWAYACLLNGGITCMPKVNLISNLGFGIGATHTVDENNERSQIPLLEVDFPLIHPKIISANSKFDAILERLVYGIGTNSGVKNLILRVCRRFKKWTWNFQSLSSSPVV